MSCFYFLAVLKLEGFSVVHLNMSKYTSMPMMKSMDLFFLVFLQMKTDIVIYLVQFMVAAASLLGWKTY